MIIYNILHSDSNKRFSCVIFQKTKIQTISISCHWLRARIFFLYLSFNIGMRFACAERTEHIICGIKFTFCVYVRYQIIQKFPKFQFYTCFIYKIAVISYKFHIFNVVKMNFLFFIFFFCSKGKKMIPKFFKQSN